MCNAKLKRQSCECALCQRGRRYYKNTESLSQEERDWMRGFYDAVLDEECEREMQAANAKLTHGATP